MIRYIYREDLEDSPTAEVLAAAEAELVSRGYTVATSLWRARDCSAIVESAEMDSAPWADVPALTVVLYPWGDDADRCDLCGAADVPLEWTNGGSVDPDTGYREADQKVCAGGCRAHWNKPSAAEVAALGIDELPF